MSFTLFDRTILAAQSASQLNFSSIHTPTQPVGYKGASIVGTSLPYVGEKPGGSDVGHVVDMTPYGQYIVKTGISLSLLGQALKKFTEQNADKERQFLSFIVGNFTRIAGKKLEDHPALVQDLSNKRGVPVTKENFEVLLTQEMLDTLNQFKETDAGKEILAKLTKKESVNTNDVYTIYRFLVANNALLKDVISLAVFSDVVNGAYGQYFSNAYQSRNLPSTVLDDHRLVVENKVNPAQFMASRFNKDAKAFDKFLVESFKHNGTDDLDTWLAKCKADLAARVPALKGLASALLIRHIMGEGADLGPDNMLLVPHNGASHVMNIDVTGFRNPRCDAFKDQLGWKNTLLGTDQTQLTETLLHTSVFSSRFVKQQVKLPKDWDAAKVQEMITKIISEVLSARMDAVSEVQDVREWLKSLDPQKTVKSLCDALDESYQAIDECLRPNPIYLERIKAHNSSFILKSIEVARTPMPTTEAAASATPTFN